MQIPVTVWPNRFLKGWDGTNLDEVVKCPNKPLEQALLEHYSTYAHFCPAVVVTKEGEPVQAQPRLNQTSLDYIRGSGADVLFYCIAADIDCPTEDVDTWWAKEKTKIPEYFAWYRTRGGYRIVWHLPYPTPVEEYENTILNVFGLLRSLGIEADNLTDWNRCYGLPFVNRDGVDLRYECHNLDNIPTFQSFDVFDFLEKAPKKEVSVTPEGGRNEMLFRQVAAKIRNTPWIQEDMYFDILQAYNLKYCDPPLDDADIETLSTTVLRYEKPQELCEVIVKKGGLYDAMVEVISILSDNPGLVYVRDSQLVQISNQQIITLSKAALRALLESMIVFKSPKKVGEDWIDIVIDCPKDLVDILDAQHEYPGVQVLEELIACPTLAPGGRILDKPGYDYETCTYLDYKPEGIDYNSINAKELIEDLLVDFPFCNDAHKAVAVASIVTPIVRTAIQGPVPLVLFDSSTPGAGKTLLADISSVLSTGQSAARMSWTREEETEKRITSLLMAGVRSILIDNVAKPIGGPSLDAVLTSDIWMGRVLGRSEMTRIKSRAQWMVSGNNVQIQGDLARRAIHSYLDPEVENPEKRTGFKHPDILDHCRRNRSVLVYACIKFVKEFLDSKDRVTLPPIGSFESWSRIVREAIVWHGYADPVDTQESLKDDDPTVFWGYILQSCKDIWGSEWFSSKDIYDCTYMGVRRGGSKEAYIGLKENIDLLVQEVNPKSISWLFKKWQNRVIGGLRMIRSVDKQRLVGYTYRVENMNQNKLQVVQ